MLVTFFVLAFFILHLLFFISENVCHPVFLNKGNAFIIFVFLHFKLMLRSWLETQRQATRPECLPTLLQGL